MEVFGKVPFTGDFRVRLTERLSDFVEYLLPDMDRHGVDMQVLSLTAPGVQADLRPADARSTSRGWQTTTWRR